MNLFFLVKKPAFLNFHGLNESNLRSGIFPHLSISGHRAVITDLAAPDVAEKYISAHSTYTNIKGNNPVFPKTAYTGLVHRTGYTVVTANDRGYVHPQSILNRNKQS